MKLLNKESSNPMFNKKILENVNLTSEEKMTVTGTVNKTLILLTVTVITALFSWKQMLMFSNIYAVLFITMILGIGLVFFAMKKPQYAPIIAPGYAFIEGLLIGAVSAMYGMFFEGIVVNATLLTFGTVFLMLGIYKTGLIKVTDKFRMVISMAVGAIGVMYLISWIMGFWGVSIPFLHDNSPLAIGVCIAIIIVASLTLLLDFDMIEKNSKSGAPKEFEWLGAMALLVTIIWLYFEFLRLLSKLQD